MLGVLRVETYRSGTSSRSSMIPSISHIWKDFNEEEAETNINCLSTSDLTSRRVSFSRLVNEATLMDVKLWKPVIPNLERPWDEGSSEDVKFMQFMISNLERKGDEGNSKDAKLLQL